MCYFATDVHSGTLGNGEVGGEGTLERVGEVRGECVLVSFVCRVVLFWRGLGEFDHPFCRPGRLYDSSAGILACGLFTCC